MTETARPLATNWAGNHTYPVERLHRPTSVEQLQEVVAGARSVRVLGSRHSFTGIADAADLVSLEVMHGDSGFPAAVTVDPDGRTVSFGGGLKYGELVERLHDDGLALHNLASLPHISVAGAVATATHGSGVANGNLATAVAALEMVTSDGGIVRTRRGDPDFDGMVVGLGALGAVTRVTLDVEPAYEVRQDVFEGLPWDVLLENLDGVLSSGYSVSVFTVLRETVDLVWVKSRTDGARDVPDELFGAPAATVDRHPVIGLDPTPCTPQLGRPGPWYDRLPHFRMGFTPSAGEELQSEYLLPRRHGAAAVEALLGLADRIRPLLLTCEIRAVAADRLWMSTSCGEDSVALHFTWAPAQAEVESVLAALEAALLPFGARPHWGKLFLADAVEIAGLYPRHADFARLVERMDPRGAFRNPWLTARVLGTG
ncbi:UNVERIFIED_ORG: FAD-binding protein [Bacillus sp. AZ43]